MKRLLILFLASNVAADAMEHQQPSFWIQHLEEWAKIRYESYTLSEKSLEQIYALKNLADKKTGCKKLLKSDEIKNKEDVKFLLLRIQKSIE